jgi:hypothetical protein
MGLVQAAVLGLTHPSYKGTRSLQFIPNMDGFPNGRRLEDDVTRIELQAVSGVVLAAIGLWYDDFDGKNPVSQDLIDVLSYSTGVEKNDISFKTSFPYVALPWAGDGKCGGTEVVSNATLAEASTTESVLIKTPQVIAAVYPNPVKEEVTFNVKSQGANQIQIDLYDLNGRKLASIASSTLYDGENTVQGKLPLGLANGTYFARVIDKNGNVLQNVKLIKVN